MMKDWHWKLYLGIVRTSKLKSLFSVANYPCGVFLRRDDSLFGTSRIVSLFGGRLSLLNLHECNGGCLRRRLCAWILWGNVLGSVTRKTGSGGGIRSQFIGGT